MSRVLRGYLTGGLIGASVIAATCFLVSYLTAKHVENVVVEKLAERRPFEIMGTQAYRALGSGNDDYEFSRLKMLAEQGLPNTASLLAWAYDKRGMIDERDALLLRSMDIMVDPDLLGFLTFVAPAFDEFTHKAVTAQMAVDGDVSTPSRRYNSTQTHLQGDDLQRLRACFESLKDTYGADNGRFLNRYAYFADSMNCRINKGPHDADPART